MASDNARKQVLYVGPSDREYVQLEEILSGSLWQLCRAVNCEEASEFLSRDEVAIVLSEAQMEDGGWDRLLAGRNAAVPNLIVCSPEPDGTTWTGVLASGGFDVLELPFDEMEVLRTLDVAEWDWNRRRAPLGAAAAG